ncbi:MAG TPA: efflux RND transporter periplasmic adaptor subunit [Deltaproteobacteria bacterium]|nr:efflux RND transporter periplasmic adaptor subunit [Deltaproteobacteria bacterium]
MRKIVVLGLIGFFVIAVLLRIQIIESLSGKEAVGIEQYYKTNGIPVEADIVKRGPFRVSCRVNAMVLGHTQVEISTPVAAKILRVHHKVGDMVKANEVIISLDKEDPKSSAQYRQLSAVFETTLKNYTRMMELRDSGAVSQSQLDEIKMKLDVDRANLESVIEAVSLSSSIDGIILDLNAREGEFITPMRPVAVVARVDRVRLVAEVSESDIRRIEPGQRVFANGNHGEGMSMGTVTKISLNANPKTGLFRVEMETDNRSNILKIGTYTAAQIEIINDSMALYADLRAIQQDADGSFYVYRIVDDQVSRKTIKITGMNDEYARILSGLEENDMVVVSGFTRLSDMTKVAY